MFKVKVRTQKEIDYLNNNPKLTFYMLNGYITNKGKFDAGAEEESSPPLPPIDLIGNKEGKDERHD